MGEDNRSQHEATITCDARLTKGGDYVVCGRQMPSGRVCGERLARTRPGDDGRRGSVHRLPKHTGGPVSTGEVFLLDGFVTGPAGIWELGTRARRFWEGDLAAAALGDSAAAHRLKEGTSARHRRSFGASEGSRAPQDQPSINWWEREVERANVPLVRCPRRGCGAINRLDRLRNTA